MKKITQNMPCITLTEKSKATTKPWFCHILWHVAMKHSGFILGHKTHAYLRTCLGPTWGTVVSNLILNCMACVFVWQYLRHWRRTLIHSLHWLCCETTEWRSSHVLKDRSVSILFWPIALAVVKKWC